jgi:hypothetical protein
MASAVAAAELLDIFVSVDRSSGDKAHGRLAPAWIGAASWQPGRLLPAEGVAYGKLPPLQVADLIRN